MYDWTSHIIMLLDIVLFMSDLVENWPLRLEKL